MKKYYFIISAKAGRSTPEKIKQKLINAYTNKINFEIIITQHENHIRDFCRDKRSDENIAIVICGGDGSVSEAANSLVHSNVPLGVIPTGTANDFSRVIYGDKSLDSIIKDFEFLKKTSIDMIKVKIYTKNGVQESYCINVLSFGFDTLILKKALEIKSKYEWLGGNSYFLSVINNLFNISEIPMDIEFISKDGTCSKISEKIILGAICNGAYYGNGFNPNPRANLSDSEVEQCFLKESSMLEILPLIIKYRSGKHISGSKVVFEKAVSGRIFSPAKDFPANIDGSIYTTNEIEWKVESNSLLLLI